MRFLKFISKIFKEFPSLFIVSIILQTGVTVMAASALLIISPLVDFLLHPDFQGISPLTQKILNVFLSVGITLNLKGAIVFFIALVAGTSILQIFSWRAILIAKYTVLKNLMIKTFEDFFQAQWYFFSSSKQGTLINTFTRELMVVGNAFSSMARFFVNLLQICVILMLPVYISWQVTVISLVAAIILILPFMFVGKYSYYLGALTTSTANQVTSVIYENLSLTKLLLGFGNQQTGIDKLDDAFDTHQRVAIKSLTIAEAIPLLYRPLAIGIICIALFASRWFQVPLSELTVLVLALFQASLCLNKLASEKNKLDNFFPSYEQIERLREKACLLKQNSGEKKFLRFQNEIKFQGLSFSYPKHDLVLNDINLEIPKGEMIAIVGKSGAGKSTLIDMLMGFYSPKRGDILFDGISLQEFDINSYRKRIGYVPQDSVLFDMSIRDNLLWANPYASDEEIQQACQSAYCDEFIRCFPDKYNTLVGDRGIRLSGGQIQRIALARALLRKPELLILDEATSALDTHSEQLIQHAIENIAKETTIVVVAHRLSTIKKADCIYVLDKGTVVEKGPYGDLIDIKGSFRSMVQLQELNAV